MEDNSLELINLFKEIAKKRWIKGVGRSWGDIGLTFENEIGKRADSEYKPDYGDIEIKCSSRYSEFPLYLFTISFDGPTDSEISRLVEKYGYYDHDFPDKKVMFRKITKEINELNKYNFMFDVDRKEEKIYLCIFDGNGELLERESYINFNKLKEHIETKIKKIAYIRASIKRNNGINYYRYYSINLYNFKGFDTFLKLIEENDFHIELISRIGKSGIFKGKYKNKNIVFSLPKDKIEKLFDCYAEYNNDIPVFNNVL